ncbi:MAG: ABC transporter substrate-binding protein [Pseudomonadota bacterium]
MRSLWTGMAVLAVGLSVGMSTVPALAQEKLIIWWTKGFYRAEDEALAAAIRKFEATSGVKVELTLAPSSVTMAKTQAALAAGAPPDLAYADSFDLETAALWAFEGRLDDLTGVIEPFKDRFAPSALEAAYLLNGETGKRAYYAFPVKQQMLHIHYWKDMLGTAGFKENDIPWDWKEFWSFWCGTVQPAYREATGEKIHAVGQPLGIDSADTYRSFLTWLDAYGVKLVDEDGKFLTDDPAVKRGLAAALKDYVEIYLSGCSPPASATWKAPDNSRAFNAREVMLTHNAGITIVGKWFDDANNRALSPEQRAFGRRAYDEMIATAAFPKKLDGQPMVYRSSVKVALVFEQSKHKPQARAFLRFLLENDGLRLHVEGALGRWFPVTIAGQKSPFWLADRHRKAVYDQYMVGTLPFQADRNYKFAQLNKENVWAKAMHRVIDDKVPVEQAVDELLARIREVAGE